MRRDCITDKESRKKLSDAVREADHVIEPVKTRTKERIKLLLNHSALFVTIITIALLMLLYAYNTGYYGVYKIPFRYYTFDLHVFLSVGVQLCSAFLCIVYYSVSWKTDVALRKNRINPLRILWGAYSLSLLFQKNEMSGKAFIIITLIIPLVVEVILFFIRSASFKEKELSEQEYQLKLEDIVENRLFVSSIVSPLVFIAVLVIMIAPVWGRQKAIWNKHYETTMIESQEYVILSEYKDFFVLEKCEIMDNDITIYTDELYITSIEDRIVSYRDYSNVCID